MLALIAQLKQRKLVQWALAYAAAAFALLQGVDIIAHQFDWPADIQRGITLALVLGFFVACLLAWYHGERGAQRVSGTELVILALLLTIGGATIWFLAPDRALSERVASAPESTSPAHAIRSIAVLPLDNYSGDASQEYFAEGMTDQLTTDLAMISRLRVISRGSTTQFKGDKRPPTPEIAKLLSVDAVVEGSVLRVGERVRITAQLIDAVADKHLWAKSFEGDSVDVLAVQDRLAAAIAQEINVQLTPGEQSRLSSSPNVNPEAYDAYLRGRYFYLRLSDENIQKAIAQFQHAIQLDPTFAPAYSGLADSYLWAGFNEGVYTATEVRPKVLEAADRAIQLDSASGEAHNSMAQYLCFFEYDWPRCEAEFRKAIALRPNYAYAHDQYAITVAFEGKFDLSLAESERAAALDPLSPLMVMDLAIPLAFDGKYEKARARVARGMYLAPDFFYGYWLRGWTYIEEGKSGDGIADLRRATELESPVYPLAWLGYAYGASGDRVRALATIEAMTQRSPNERVAPFNLALVHLGLGNNAQALTDLEQAQASDTQWLGYLKLSHVFDPLRAEPRFHVLMKQAGFDVPESP